MKARLEAIKKFLGWVFGERHWKKSCILLAIIVIGIMLIYKDCYIKTGKVEIRTDTKLETSPDGKNKIDTPPRDFPMHR